MLVNISNKNQLYKKIMGLFGATLLLMVFPLAANATTVIDDTQGEIDAGTHSDTQWDSGNSWLEMDATGQTNGSANFTSRVIDAGATASWDTFSWVPRRPLLKELPNNDGVETAYAAGNIDMTSNNVLLHLNESNGATTFTDNSGNSNTGSCTNCPDSTSSGLFNNAFTFNGTDDSIQLPTQAVGTLFTSQFTISFWANPGSTPDRPTFGFTENNGGYNAYNPISSYDSALNIGNGSTYQLITPIPNAAANVWSHYSIVADGTNYIVYVNGVQQTSTEIQISPAGATDNTFTIGRSGFGTGYDNWFNGSIDEFAILNRGLSPTEVTDLYKRGALRLRLQVRSCNDALCSGESFVGTSGSGSAYFEEQDSNTTSLPSFSLSGVVSSNRYFQYKSYLESSSASLSPEITSTSITYSSIVATPEFSTFVLVLTVLAAAFYLQKTLQSRATMAY